jgi:hypothetical protein
LDAITRANEKDKAGVVEDGQCVSANGGDTITLKDKDAKSHHAILWAGFANHERYVEDVKLIRNELAERWKGTDYSITVLFGNGRTDSQGNPLPREWNAKEATEATLQQTVNDLKAKINKDEQFFFYATDHGGLTAVPPGLPKRVPGKTKDIETFSLESLILDAIAYTVDNIPTLRLDYSDLLSSDVFVEFNDFLLGALDPSAAMMEFSLPESIIGLENIIEVRNESDFDFNLLNKEIFTGGNDTLELVVVPEPSGLAIFVMGVLGCLLWRKRKPSPRCHRNR